MSIQSSLNNVIMAGTAIATQTPGYKDAVEKRINAKEIKKGEAKYQDLEKQITDLDAQANDKMTPPDVAEGLNAEVKTLKAKQDIINQDLLRRGSDAALTRVGAEAAQAEANAPVEFTAEANKQLKQNELKRMIEANRQAGRKKEAQELQSEFVKNYIAAGGRLDLSTSFEQAKKENK